MLIVDDIDVERGGRLVLSAAGFRVGAGEAAVLRGPNGAGKSTLLRVLAGFVRPRRGGARCDGADLLTDHEAFAEKAAYAGHLDAVKPALSFRANLAAWASIYGGGGVEGALRRFSLDHLADMPAAYGSAGQKRRLGLARLLIMRRPLWLLDEPTVSLDAEASAAFSDVVAQHCAAGGIAVAATHIDIGMPAGPVVNLAAPSEAATEAGDAFLRGDWA